MPGKMTSRNLLPTPGAKRLRRQRSFVLLAGANAHHAFQVEDKILPSPILLVLAACVIASTDFLDDSVRDSHLDLLDFRQEAHFVFSAAIDFRLALLAAIAAHFSNGDARGAGGGHGVKDGVETARV